MTSDAGLVPDTRPRSGELIRRSRGGAVSPDADAHANASGDAVADGWAGGHNDHAHGDTGAVALGLGGFAIPTASVAPLNAVGTVQFKARATSLGRPVLVIGGTALGTLSFLSTGQHPLTTVFTPINPAKFTPSTSNIVTFDF